MNAVDGESPRCTHAGGGWAQHDANLEFVAIALRLHPAGDASGRLAETNQFRRLLCARRAGQRRKGYGLEQVGLSLSVAAEESAGGAL